MENNPSLGKPLKKESFALIFSIFIAGLCSIVYELLIGTTSSYFLGDSVKQFSLTIGLYMASMGVGSYLSRYIDKKIFLKFIYLEILLGFIGGISVPSLYMAFAYTEYYQFFMFGFIISIGLLIGLEIPLLTRLMQKYYVLKINISNILSLDYFGALIATLIFPFVLLPFVGIFKSSLVFGLINMLIGFVVLWAFKKDMDNSKWKISLAAAVTVSIFLFVIIYLSNFLLKSWQGSVYEDRVVYSKHSNYQQITLTKNKQDIRLFLNGGLQFSTIDEYRYHESLIHIPLGLAQKKERVLILGGGDGLAVRELLKHKDINDIVLVDLDPFVVKLSKENTHILQVNEGSLNNKKVHVINRDAFIFLKENNSRFDIIIADLPDPNNISVARLYSLEFYKLVLKNLNQQGIFLTQATSPYFANKTFWCIFKTIKSAGLKYSYPYHVNIPSFGEWGFVLASRERLKIEEINLIEKTKYLNSAITKSIFTFSNDIYNPHNKYSTLENPQVLTFYMSEWKHWN